MRKSSEQHFSNWLFQESMVIANVCLSNHLTTFCNNKFIKRYTHTVATYIASCIASPQKERECTPGSLCWISHCLKSVTWAFLLFSWLLSDKCITIIIGDQICKEGLPHTSNSMDLEDHNLVMKDIWSWQLSIYVDTSWWSNVTSVAITNLKLWIIKVGKFDVCGKPSFANPVTFVL